MKSEAKIQLGFRIKYAIVLFLTGVVLTLMAVPAVANEVDSNAVCLDDLLLVRSQATGQREEMIAVSDFAPPIPPEVTDDESSLLYVDTLAVISGRPQTIYASQASWTYSDPWWHGMWINTAVLSGAFVSTLFVLELLPEDATAWNRAEINRVPFYERWYTNIFKLGPTWDHDHFVFNYILHPYAGAAYFMAARTCGFNFWQSMLYSAAISTFGWEFGIEACMERPSYQDLFITPVIGSLIGEGCYRLKRLIVQRDYQILGSPVIGHIVAFFLDPVNEVVGLLSRDACRSIGPGCLSSQPLLIPSPSSGSTPSFGIRLAATF